MVRYVVCAYLLAVVIVSGCAGVKEGAKGFLGISTRELEKGRKEAAIKTFQCASSACYDTILATLKKIGAYVYAEDSNKKMIALYVSETDTTPVGIFLTEENKAATRVEVSSPGGYAKEFIAGKVFAVLSTQCSSVQAVK
ncbi:MAG: hypothetical protein C4540_03950 [Candidatus Omnitrophota bacterium]|jgi:hypothetical protein|nr:MAG: hypothetical protein C4540_03950 [Candidatus Omnitrophota bacterium]